MNTSFHYRKATLDDIQAIVDLLLEDELGKTREQHVEELDLAPAFDHEFMSPTYQERLQLHIKNYLTTQGKML